MSEAEELAKQKSRLVWVLKLLHSALDADVKPEWVKHKIKLALEEVGEKP